LIPHAVSTIVGLDHGARRIGVAVGDTDIGMAFARPAIRRQRDGSDLEAVAALLARERADVVVVGLPLHGDGAEGDQAAAARRYGERLERLGIVVHYEDERLTSWAAGEDLRESGRNPERGSGELDSAAARLILQQYLDARRRTARPEET
jgi:putative holliday junction resolvase